MVSLKMEGLDKFIDLCDLTVKQTDKLCSRAIYPGGGIMYDYANQATRAIRTDPVGFRKSGMKWGPSKEQRDGLIESLGIAPIRKQRWGMNVKIGYDGYNNIVTERWPQGQPNMMIARSVESGTSFMQPQYFMEKAVQRATPAVEKAIEAQFAEELTNIWGAKL